MATAKRVPVAVLGATGYVGVELLRVLARHPGVEPCVSSVSRQARADVIRAPVHVNSRSRRRIPMRPRQGRGRSRQPTARLIGRRSGSAGGVIASRRTSPAARRRTATRSGTATIHAAPELLTEAVYGIPEIHRERSEHAARRRAGLLPDARCSGSARSRGRLVRETVVIDAKSGHHGREAA
jgi:N-acetyl-gamma-glutamylphosphate reductase